MSDDLSPEERALLGELPAPASPPPGFAASVVGELSRERARSRRWVWPAAAALAASVAAAWWASSLSVGGPSGGALEASTARQSATLGGRGVAVGEAGAAMTWTVARDGAAVIEQTAGDVFYRVEPGGPFVVKTVAGEVRVTGTCFRVEVSAVKSNINHVISGAAGAAVAAIVTITVYEGRVVAAGAEGGAPQIVEAGGRAELGGGGPARRIDSATRAPAGERSVAAAVRASASPLPQGLTAEQLYEAHAQVSREAAALRARVDGLEQEIKAAKDKSRGHESYDLSPEELAAMAQNCELRWDLVPLRDDKLGLSVGDAEKLSMSEEERATVSRLMRASSASTNETIRALYVELTGDPSAGSLTPQAMIEEIRDKTAAAERKAAYQRIARDRAGLANPPSASPASPYERLHRALTQAGDALEADLGKELGSEAARRVRDLHNGWGSVHRSSEGCPGGGGGE